MRKLILLLISLLILFSGCNNQRKVNTIAENHLNKANEFLRNDAFDSSINHLKLVMQQETSDGKESIFFDEAGRIKESINKYLLWESDEKYKEILATMPDYEYELLSKNKLYKAYVFHSYLDSLIINTLYKHRFKRDEFIKEREYWQKERDSLYGKIIGKWKGNSIVGGIFVIVQQEQNFILNVENTDGSESSDDLIVKKIKGKRCFFKKNNRFGDYFVITDRGMLGIHDNEGLITTLMATKL